MQEELTTATLAQHLVTAQSGAARDYYLLYKCLESATDLAISYGLLRKTLMVKTLTYGILKRDFGQRCLGCLGQRGLGQKQDVKLTSPP